MGYISRKRCIWAVGSAVMLALTLAVTRSASAADGAAVYKSYCAPCHGEEGRGDGPVAQSVFPKPRDFTTGAYKVRSTPSGSLPSDEDIRRVITYGMPGTSMTPWDVLEPDEIDALIPVIKGFSEAFQYRQPEPAVAIGLEPRMTAQSIARGRAIYEEKECWKCHGEEGKGDGPSADELVDDWGNPAPPFDFTSGGNLRGGNSDRDLYLRFTTGMTGTPMPSFATELSDADRWALVHYIRALMGQSE